MITWKFKELDITFKSKASNLLRDFSKMAYANRIEQDAEITIINVNGNTNHTLPTDAISGNGNTSPATQSTISADTKDISCPEPEADELPTVFSDMDNADPDLDLLD